MIVKTVKELSDDNELAKATIRYVLGITSSKDLNSMARKAGVFPQIKALKHTFLKGHPYTLSYFWKAVTACLTKNCKLCTNYTMCRQYSLKKNCSYFSLQNKKLKKFKVSEEDIQFTLDFLSNNEKNLLIKKYAARANQTQKFSKNKVCISLYPWVLRLVWKKFKFVIQYHNIDPEDIAHDLLIEGHTRALECDTITDKLLFTNTIKRRIKQRAVNLINYYTSAGRQRISKVEEDRTTKINQLAYTANLDHLPFEQKELRFKNYLDDFQVNCLSLDSKLSDEQEGSFHDFLSTEEDITSNLDEKELLNLILKDLPTDTYRRIFKILVGYPDSEFAKYLDSGKTESITRVLSFFDVKKNAFYDEMGKILVKNNIVTEDTIVQLRGAK